VYQSQQTSGDVTCPVRSCRWRSTVTVAGGHDDLRREHDRVVAEHQRHDHPWMFVEFRDLPDDPPGLLGLCVLCGAVVDDRATHTRWHEAAEA
jgi:hypothetical protein